MVLTHSPTDAAARLGISETFLREKVRAGEVPCFRAGRRAIRFTDEHIQQILEILSEPARQKPSRLSTPRSRKRTAA